MAIIPRKTRRQQLITEQANCNTLAISRRGNEGEAYRLMAWEISDAIMEADINALEMAIWRAKHPSCHDHGMRICPICHRQPAEVDPTIYDTVGLQ